nr:MAG TPA: hypothetical protein [Caudoviricetes sp.]
MFNLNIFELWKRNLYHKKERLIGMYQSTIVVTLEM